MQYIILFLLALIPLSSQALVSSSGIVDEKGMWLEKLDFLSAEAKDNLKKLKDKKHEIKTKMMEVCGITPALSDDNRAAIKKIREDASLKKAEKRAKIKEILKPLRAQMKANRKALKECKEKQKDALKPLVDQKQALMEACFGVKEHKKLYAKRMLRNLSEAKKKELNAKLVSTECTNALAN